MRHNNTGRSSSRRVQPKENVAIQMAQSGISWVVSCLTPIICKNVPRLVPGWTQPIVIGRHAYGDQYRATDFIFSGKGTLTMKFVSETGEITEKEVFKAPSSGVAMGMYNLDQSIIDFARASLNYGLNLKWPVFLSTKNTILKTYDGRFKDLFEKIYQEEFRNEFEKQGIYYEHRLIDDMVASAIKWSGGCFSVKTMMETSIRYSCTRIWFPRFNE